MKVETDYNWFNYCNDKKLIINNKVAIILASNNLKWFSLDELELFLLFNKTLAELVLNKSFNLITKDLIIEILSKEDYMNLDKATEEFEINIQDYFNDDLIKSLYVKWLPKNTVFLFNNEEISIIDDIKTLTTDQLNKDLLTA